MVTFLSARAHPRSIPVFIIIGRAQLWIHFDKSGSKGKLLEISKHSQIIHNRRAFRICYVFLVIAFDSLGLV